MHTKDLTPAAPLVAINLGSEVQDLVDDTVARVYDGRLAALADSSPDLDAFAARFRDAWLDGQTVYRLSPAGVLAKRDVRREPGWTEPHWVVVDLPAGDLSHHLGQHLTDAAVADWDRLVRARTAVTS